MVATTNYKSNTTRLEMERTSNILSCFHIAKTKEHIKGKEFDKNESNMQLMLSTTIFLINNMKIDVSPVHFFFPFRGVFVGVTQ